MVLSSKLRKLLQTLEFQVLVNKALQALNETPDDCELIRFCSALVGSALFGFFLAQIDISYSFGLDMTEKVAVFQEG